MKRAHASTRRKATNLSLDAQLVKDAQALNLNISQLVEKTLTEAVREARQKQWLEENKAGFEAANRAIAKYGIFNADEREW